MFNINKSITLPLLVYSIENDLPKNDNGCYLFYCFFMGNVASNLC